MYGDAERVIADAVAGPLPQQRFDRVIYTARVRFEPARLPSE
jgi:hypothetical protein